MHETPSALGDASSSARSSASSRLAGARNSSIAPSGIAHLPGSFRASAGGLHWSPLRWFVHHFDLQKDKGRDDKCRRERFT